MNRLRSFERPKTAAKAAAVAASLLTLSGCGISLSNPDMKPQDKAKFERILKPAAVKAAQSVVKFVKEDKQKDMFLSYVSRDEDTDNGYDIDIEGLTAVGPRVEFKMKGYRKNGKLVLLPTTTYYAEGDNDLKTGKDEFYDNELIASTEGEASSFRRRVWFAQIYTGQDHNGKLADNQMGDTHVYSPRDKDEISTSLDFARSVAADFPQNIAEDLKEIKGA